MKKEKEQELKITVYTNEERNEYVANILCKAIAKYLYEKHFKPITIESC